MPSLSTINTDCDELEQINGENKSQLVFWTLQNLGSGLLICLVATNQTS